MSTLHPALAALFATVASGVVPSQQGPELTIRMTQTPVAPQVHSTLAKITVAVDDGVASTEISETIRNDGPRDAEADWLMPVPPGCAVDGFKMIVGGKEQNAEILDAGKARGIYEEIVRRRRDPGLLEYVDCGLLRARVFPIPAQGSVEVRVRWREVLPQSGGQTTFEFPLRAAMLGGRPVDKVALDLSIRSRTPLRGVWSPLPGVEISKKSDHEARVGFELAGGQIAQRDLAVFYTTTADDFGLTFLPYRVPGKDGHFALIVTPKNDWADDPQVVRVVQFVVDTSGSMQGAKIEQARKALRFFVDSLRPIDRFNVIPFSTEARPFFEAAAAADPEHLQKARENIASIEARGGTNIDEAIATALRSSSDGVAAGAAGQTVVPIIVFLTDGLPTVGDTDVEHLIQKAVAAQGNAIKPRFFVFGVGSDVNTRLLDAIADRTRGDRDYVREDEDIEVKTGALFQKLSHPVLTDVQLAFDGIQVDSMEPTALPDLFRGSRLMVFGRYRGDGAHAIRLRGKVGGKEKEFVYEAGFPADAMRNDFVAALWAQRRVAHLLDAIRLNGAQKELVDEVTQLGREYGIATPYTSHLIVEEGMHLATLRGLPDANGVFFMRDGDDATRERLAVELGRVGFVAPPTGGTVTDSLQEEAESLKQEARDSRGRLTDLPSAPASGKEAVEQSVALRRLGSLDAGAGLRTGGRGSAGRSALVQRFAGHGFVLVGDTWVDQLYTAEMKGKEKRIEAFSDDYFALLRAHPELRMLFAFTTRVVLVIGGAAIEIVAAG
ncbi:MAG: VIT domain-containing protein [Planctomycetota bacterium]